jgi:hypothetical protein
MEYGLLAARDSLEKWPDGGQNRASNPTRFDRVECNEHGLDQ